MTRALRTGQVTRLEYNGDGSLAGIVKPPPSEGETGQHVSFLYNGRGDLVSVNERAAEPVQTAQ